METKQAAKKLPEFIRKKNKTDLSKTWETICSIVSVGRKTKCTPSSLKHNSALLFNPELKLSYFFCKHWT